LELQKNVVEDLTAAAQLQRQRQEEHYDKLKAYFKNAETLNKETPNSIDDDLLDLDIDDPTPNLIVNNYGPHQSQMLNSKKQNSKKPMLINEDSYVRQQIMAIEQVY
jgi:hypothetical protein